MSRAGNRHCSRPARVAWSAAGFAVLVLVAAFAASMRWIPTDAGALDNLWILSWLGLPVVGAMIASRRPRTKIGWLLLGLGVCFACGLGGSAYAELSIGRGLVDLPAANYVLWAASVLFVPAFLLVTMLLVFFPGDRLPSRRWRVPVAAAVVVALVDMACWAVRPEFKILDGKVAVDNPMAVDAVGAVAETLIAVTGTLVGVFGLAAAVNVVWRYVRASGEQRLQMKWFAFAVLAFPVLFLTASLSKPIGGESVANALVVFAFVLSLNALAAAIAVAVLRYRLYEIDRVVSRTVTYAVVTAVIALPYVLAVPLVTRVVSSDLTVAAATLAAAAAFNPLRQRVQARVDHRFNRSRYDAARTVEAFSRQLRDEVNLDQLSSDLVAVVHTTMQPTHVSLWLREAEVAQ